MNNDSKEPLKGKELRDLDFSKAIGNFFFSGTNSIFNLES